MRRGTSRSPASRTAEASSRGLGHALAFGSTSAGRSPGRTTRRVGLGLVESARNTAPPAKRVTYLSHEGRAGSRWEPVSELMAEIHNGDPLVRAEWTCRWWGLEPLDRRGPHWQTRYASVFRVRQAA